jgi:hypothetical protein
VGALEEWMPLSQAGRENRKTNCGPASPRRIFDASGNKILGRIVKIYKLVAVKILPNEPI